MDRERVAYQEGTGNYHWAVLNYNTIWAGGKPSRGTPADRRLSGNKGKPPTTPKPMPRKGGKS